MDSYMIGGGPSWLVSKWAHLGLGGAAGAAFDRAVTQDERWIAAGGRVMELNVAERDLSPEDQVAIDSFMAGGFDNNEEDE